MPDKKKTIEILIIVIGGAFLLYRIFAPKMITKQVSSEIAPASGVEISALKEAADKAARSEEKLKSEAPPARNIFQKPDEFFAPAAKTPGSTDAGSRGGALSLEGTIWGHGRNIAIISGTVVSEGDTIQGSKIVKIEQDRVRILRDGVESEIKRGA